ncbi:hypothetical protein ZWY2020_017963 [Hordeum vulgare]|nr:hypothetical protein ZWY2020_017963 [Hordeum vulgare]
MGSKGSDNPANRVDEYGNPFPLAGMGSARRSRHRQAVPGPQGGAQDPWDTASLRQLQLQLVLRGRRHGREEEEGHEGEDQGEAPRRPQGQPAAHGDGDWNRRSIRAGTGTGGAYGQAARARRNGRHRREEGDHGQDQGEAAGTALSRRLRLAASFA